MTLLPRYSARVGAGVPARLGRLARTNKNAQRSN
jgi:hypothetical protein